jgi:GH35 family endo-1,4-beta-xylanase
MKTQDPEKREFLKERMNKWLALFNYGTLPFYWGRYEPVEGTTAYPETMAAARWLKDQGVRVKGHPLCWHTACADWLMKYDNETIMKKQLERIDREVTGFKGIIDMWDVINEVVIMPIFDKYDNAITRICKEKGRVGLIKTIFDKAHECNPNATLLLNDFNTSINSEILIDGCLNAGVPISAIGIQSRQPQGSWGREKLEEVLERFSSFGLPIHFTENTLISGEIMPAHIVDLNDWQVDEWPTTPEGEERQAKEIEEMYRILFAHPLVEAITTWDFKDGAWLNAPSGYVRKDGSQKPSYKMLKNLVRNEWWTNTSVTTDENGFATVSGFKGEYKLSADGLTASESLTDEGELVVTLK